MSLFVVHDSAPYVTTNCVIDPFIFTVVPTILSSESELRTAVVAPRPLLVLLYLPGLCLFYLSRFQNNYI
jgi:hypothetical protein